MTEAGLLQAPAGSQRRRPEATPSLFSTIRPLGGGWHDAFLNRGLRFEAEQAMCGGGVDPGSKKQGTAWEHLITLLAKWTPPLIIDVHLVLAFYTPCLGDDSIRRNPEIKDGATCDARALMAPPTWSCIKKKEIKNHRNFRLECEKVAQRLELLLHSRKNLHVPPHVGLDSLLKNTYIYSLFHTWQLLMLKKNVPFTWTLYESSPFPVPVRYLFLSHDCPLTATPVQHPHGFHQNTCDSYGFFSTR